MNYRNQNQITNHLLMVRPAYFAYNEETAKTNAFQTNPKNTDDSSAFIRQQAIAEFDKFVAMLRENGVDVTVAKDRKEPITPDAVFPNNWITFHENGVAVTYPMESISRRGERNEDIIEQLSEDYELNAVFNLDIYEERDLFLEGTGSMILDRQYKIVYACLSPRTDLEVLEAWCKLMGYRKVTFHSVDANDKDIYHTNVMMSMGIDYVVICMESIKSVEEQQMLKRYFRDTKKEIIEITYEQMLAFAGNMLQVMTKGDVPKLVMSSQAYHSLREDQIKQIEKYNPILHSPIPVIETYGGGGVRCMMAEVFLPKKQDLSKQKSTRKQQTASSR